jgi:hypothetical protein
VVVRSLGSDLLANQQHPDRTETPLIYAVLQGDSSHTCQSTHACGRAGRSAKASRGGPQVGILAGMEPARVWTTTARYSFGQFFVAGGGPAPVFDFDLPSVGARAIDAGGIAQQDSFLVVLSPKQRTSSMTLRVEVWAAAPADDEGAWQEGFVSQIHIHPANPKISGGTFTYDNLDWNSHQSFDVAPGFYNLRISGRGFDRDDDQGEEWRVQLWPASPSEAQDGQQGQPRRTSAYQPPPLVRPEPEFREAGVAAVRRIHRDLDEERTFSGVRATVTAERTLRARRVKLYEHFRYPLWLTAAGARRPAGFMLEGVNGIRRHSDGGMFADERKIVACDGMIECEHLDGQKPAFSLSSWLWLRVTPGSALPQARGGAPGAMLVSADPPPMTLRFDLAQATGTGGQPVTTVRVTHDQVPVEWLEDLTAYWQWMLERVDYDLDLVKR